MSSTKRIITLSTAICFAIALIVATSANVAHAYPGSGINCSNCHSNTQEGLMEVSGEDKMLDLGTQLDGNERGELKTFVGAPGEPVSLQMTVLNGSPSSSVQIKRLDSGGQKISQDNKLIFTLVDPDSTWRERDNGGPYYTTSVVQGSNEGTVYTFDIMLDAATPADVYDLEFAIATGAFTYDDEHYYLQVIPEPTAAALAGLGLLGLIAYRRRRV